MAELSERDLKVIFGEDYAERLKGVPSRTPTEHTSSPAPTEEVPPPAPSHEMLRVQFIEPTIGQWVGFVIRVLLCITSFGLVLILVLTQSWLFGFGVFMGAVAIGAEATYPRGRWIGPCPYCGNGVQVPAPNRYISMGFDCPLCTRRIIVKEAGFHCC